MTVEQGDDPVTAETPLYGDDEAERASGVSLPSLRVLQAAGAIHSYKVPKDHGGYRRMWSETDVLKASMAAALGEHFAWNIRLVAALMAKIHSPIWQGLITIALAKSQDGQPETPEARIIKASEHDWLIQVFDRKFVFLKVPDIATAILPGAVRGQTDLLLGIAGKDTFQLIPWRLSNREGRTALEQALGEDTFRKLLQAYRLAMATNRNFLSSATINLSMQVRATWRRLHGLESHFVEEVLQFGKEA